MQNGIHFISGLPRSGSTLLSGLLRQNPRFHAHISSPVASMFGAMQTALSGRSEYYPLVTANARRAVLQGVFDNYYVDIHPAKTVFDTNRAWTGKLPALHQMFGAPKVICCVRPLAWVVDSFERLVRESPLEPSKIYSFNAGGNVYTRCEHLNSPKGVLGLPYQSLKDAFFGPHARSLLILPYEVLTRAPAHALAEIYDFLEEAPFAHDFDNVEIEADEFDRQLGSPGLHAVSRKVEARFRTLSLPPDLINRFAQSQFWTDPNRNPHEVRIVALPADARRPVPVASE